MGKILAKHVSTSMFKLSATSLSKIQKLSLLSNNLDPPPATFSFANPNLAFTM
jgi:hypothetical protein